VFYICLCDARLAEDDEKIKTCWRISGLYVKVNIVILVHLLVLSVKLVNFWQIMQCHISDHANVQFSVMNIYVC